jgi:fumarate reductase subunit D
MVKSAVSPAVSFSIARLAAAVPAAILVLFIGLLWLLGLLCGKERRKYITTLSRQAMGALAALLHGPG